MWAEFMYCVFAENFLGFSRKTLWQILYNIVCFVQTRKFQKFIILCSYFRMELYTDGYVEIVAIFPLKKSIID